MARGTHLTDLEKARIRRYIRDGWGDTEIARKVSRHPNTIRKIRKANFEGAEHLTEAVRKRPDEVIEQHLAENPAPKVRVGDLTDEAREALRHFELFAERYFHQTLYPHQREWVRHMLAHDTAMILAPPRHGKTELVSVMLVVWIICGGGHPPEYYDDPDNSLRDSQVMLVSMSEDQARKNFLAIDARLTEPGSELLKAYGRFKDDGLPWIVSRGAMVVAGRQRARLSGDYTLVSIGAKTKVLGRGAHWIILDDPADLNNCRTPHQVDELLTWTQSHIFNRLEPGGRLWCVGARLPVPEDLYSKLEELVDYTDEDEIEEDGYASEPKKLFSTITQPAVLDWDERKLLCPERHTWKSMMRLRSIEGEQVFEAMFQQNPRAGSWSFCKREWIYGEDGHPGCLDEYRTWGVEPFSIVGENDNRQGIWYGGQQVSHVRVMSIDPSPTQYCGCLLMDIPNLMNEVYAPWLVDIKRDRLPTEPLIDLMYEWLYRYQYRVLVIEQNAAHNLVQSERFRTFRTVSNVRIVFHSTTGKNKPDRDYGFGSLARDVENGHVRIPSGDLASRNKFKPLISELLEEVPTDDLVMSLWFPKWNLKGILSQTARSKWKGYGRHANRPPPRLQKAPPRIVGARR